MLELHMCNLCCVCVITWEAWGLAWLPPRWTQYQYIHFFNIIAAVAAVAVVEVSAAQRCIWAGECSHTNWLISHKNTTFGWEQQQHSNSPQLWRPPVGEPALRVCVCVSQQVWQQWAGLMWLASTGSVCLTQKACTQPPASVSPAPSRSAPCIIRDPVMGSGPVHFDFTLCNTCTTH